MDLLQLIVTTTAVIIVVLLMVYLACHLGFPKANAWLRSTHEEKIGLSHKKLYTANGLLVSELLAQSQSPDPSRRPSCNEFVQLSVCQDVREGGTELID